MATIALLSQAGFSEAQIMDDYRELDAEEVRQALAYQKQFQLLMASSLSALLIDADVSRRVARGLPARG